MQKDRRYFQIDNWEGEIHEASNDNGIRAINFAISKYLIAKSTIFPHRRAQNLQLDFP
jgi:hypothetical protein